MNKNLSRYISTGAVVVIIIGLLLLALSGYINPVINSALRPFVRVQSWVAIRYNAIYDFLTVPRDVASLRQRNAQDEAEISRLQTQIIELQNQINETKVLYALLGFARENPENKYVASSVIGRDPSPFLHYIIIDHGSDDGIKHGMPVVTQNGLVGTVDAVTSGAARVQLINDPNSIVNVILQSSNTEVTMTGSITGEISLTMIPQDLSIPDGEVVLTSGLGGKFPSNIMVGQVAGIRKESNDLFQTGSIQTVVDFSNLSVVLVITNFRPLDITPLIPTAVP
jgi:rod shape-determining protein MreC